MCATQARPERNSGFTRRLQRRAFLRTPSCEGTRPSLAHRRRFRLAATPRGASAAERQEYGTALRGVDDGEAAALNLLEELERMCPKRAEVCFAALRTSVNY